MKTYLHNTRYLAFAVFALLLSICSCHHAPSEADRLLDRVDSLCYTNPDSAVTLVSQLPDSTISTWPEATRMRYHLMHIKALDKAYLDITGDTLMPTVLSYYKSRNDRRFLPEAYFYSGRFCADIGDAPQAMEYYNQALQASEETEQTRQIKIVQAVIYSQMGVVCHTQNLIDDALYYAQKAYTCDSMLNRFTGMVYDLCDMADRYAFKGEYDQALLSAEKAGQIADSNHSKQMLSKALLAKASVYDLMGCYKESLDALKRAIPNLEKRALCDAYYSLSYLYHFFGELDTAAYYYDKMVNGGNSLQKVVAHKGLAQIALAQNHYELADSLYYESFYAYDAWRTQTQSDATKRVLQVYNYQLQEKKAKDLDEKSERQQMQIYLLVCSLILLAVLLYLFFNRYKTLQQEKRDQAIRFKLYEAELYRRSEEYIQANLRKIEELETQRQHTDEQNESLRKQIVSQKQMLEAANKQVLALREQEAARQNMLRSSDMNKQLKTMVQKHEQLSDEFRSNLETTLIQIHPGFMEKLNSMHLNATERYICILLKMELSPGEIAPLIGRQLSSVTSARTRMYQKIFGKKGDPRLWDEYIRSL